MKEGASPDQIEAIIKDCNETFGAAHLAAQMSQADMDCVDQWCDANRNAPPEVLDEQERIIMESRARKNRSN